MLGHRRRRWPNIDPALAWCLVFAGMGLKWERYCTWVKPCTSYYVTINCFCELSQSDCDWTTCDQYCSAKAKGSICLLNPLTAKLFNLNFHPPEVVSRWRDPKLQVSENYSDLTKWRSTLFKSRWLMSHFIFNMFKMWYFMCQNENPYICDTGG